MGPLVLLTKGYFLIINWFSKYVSHIFPLDHKLLKERDIMVSCLVATFPDSHLSI